MAVHNHIDLVDQAPRLPAAHLRTLPDEALDRILNRFARRKSDGLPEVSLWDCMTRENFQREELRLALGLGS